MSHTRARGCSGTHAQARRHGMSLASLLRHSLRSHSSPCSYCSSQTTSCLPVRQRLQMGPEVAGQSSHEDVVQQLRWAPRSRLLFPSSLKRALARHGHWSRTCSGVSASFRHTRRSAARHFSSRHSERTGAWRRLIQCKPSVARYPPPPRTGYAPGQRARVRRNFQRQNGDLPGQLVCMLASSWAADAVAYQVPISLSAARTTRSSV